MGPWQSETLDPSFLSIGVRVKGPGLGKEATKKSSKAPWGVVQTPARLAAGLGVLDWGSGCPSQGRNLLSWP